MGAARAVIGEHRARGATDRGAGASAFVVPTKQVIGLLNAMGYRKSESRWLVWTALRGDELPRERSPTVEELLRAALRAGTGRGAKPSPRPARRGHRGA